MNDDDIVSGSDLVQFLGTDWCTSVPNECEDINEDGIKDAKDVLALIQRKGYTCEALEEILPTTPSFNGIQLVDFGAFPECSDLLITENLPPNTHIYRLYAQILDEGEILSGVYGTTELPLEITTTTSFVTIDALNGIFANTSASAFQSIWPCYSKRTYLAFGYDELLEDGQNIWFGSSCLGEIPYLEMQSGGNLVVTEGNMAFARENYIPLPEYQGEWRLIAQLVTDGEINGVLNLAVADGLDRHELVCFEGLTFGMDNLLVAGCMDEAAMNFDPNADFPTPCFYPGDVNADGEIDLEDLINFLNDFGCYIDCGFADMNGDGVVNAADLILLLQFLNCC